MAFLLTPHVSPRAVFTTSLSVLAPLEPLGERVQSDDTKLRFFCCTLVLFVVVVVGRTFVRDLGTLFLHVMVLRWLQEAVPLLLVGALKVANGGLISPAAAGTAWRETGWMMMTIVSYSGALARDVM